MKINYRVTNESGYSLVWVLIVMMVGTILGTSFLTLAMAETKHAVRSENQMQVNYIARSGVEAGFLTLQTISDSSTATTPEAFTDAANQYLITNNLKTQVVGNGSFTITYVPDPNPNSFFITIESVATHTSNPAIKRTVELYVNSTFLNVPGMRWVEPPRSWMRASNLNSNVDPALNSDVDLTGSPVVFSGTPTKSPQNSVNPSVFRATLLFFRGFDRNNRISFLQQVNTNPITFDAEVIVLDGRIRLRDNSPLYLRSSDDVLRDNMPTLVPWTYPGLVGFESKARYQNFIGAAPTTIYDGYNFPVSSGPKFGLISINATEQNVVNSIGVSKDGVSLPIIPAGVYFYRDNININGTTPLIITNEYTSTSDLIRVDPGDPIRDAILNNQGTRYIRASTEKFLYSSD